MEEECLECAAGHPTACSKEVVRATDAVREEQLELIVPPGAVHRQQPLRVQQVDAVTRCVQCGDEASQAGVHIAWAQSSARVAAASVHRTQRGQLLAPAGRILE
eukprot:scaffold142991_cov130-Phaeocystis_antarctica.AAC.3